MDARVILSDEIYARSCTGRYHAAVPIDSARSTPAPLELGRWHARHLPRQPAPVDDFPAYPARMPPSAVDRVRFARFVERALASARKRGMTDADIEGATGIRASTIHRWRRGETAPTVDKVRQFAAGLGIPLAEALSALGAGPREVTPPEPLDPDVARRLNDPNTNDATRAFILAALRALADMPEQPTPARPRKRAG